MKKYKQLALNERYVIYTLCQESFCQQQIAGKLGVHPSTVGQELRRNSRGYKYDPEKAHCLALARRCHSRKPKKFTEELARILRHYSRKNWSPEQIITALVPFQCRQLKR